MRVFGLSLYVKTTMFYGMNFCSLNYNELTQKFENSCAKNKKMFILWRDLWKKKGRRKSIKGLRFLCCICFHSTVRDFLLANVKTKMGLGWCSLCLVLDFKMRLVWRMRLCAAQFLWFCEWAKWSESWWKFSELEGTRSVSR